MSILRVENDKRIALMKLLASTCSKRFASNVDFADKRTLNDKAGGLVEAILSSYYKDELSKRLAVNNNVKGFIRTKASSWLNLIDMDKFKPSMTEFNILPVSDEVLDKVVNRMVTEVTTYRSTLEDFVKPSIEEVNRYKKSIQPAKALSDVFNVEPIGVISGFKLLEDKGLLSYNLASALVNSVDNLSPVIEKLKDVNSIDDDPELAMTLKEDLKDIDTDKVMDRVDELLTGNILNNIRGCNLKDINSLTLLMATVSSACNKETPSTLIYQELNTLKAAISVVLKGQVSRYNNLAERGVLLLSFYNKDGVTTLNVLKPVYDEYLESTKSNKPLIGVYLSPVVDGSNRDIQSVDVFVHYTLENVVINKADLETRASDYASSLLLTRQNEDINKLRTYFLFGMLSGSVKCAITAQEQEEVRVAIGNLNLSELGRTEETVIKLFKEHTFKNSNMSIFLDAIEEAEFLLGKKANPRTMVSYAGLKLVTLYLASQTEVV